MSIIEVRGLRKSYGGRAVVDGVSFSVEKGEIFGILGPNGAGKTTTVECIGGLRTRDGGTITVAGFDPAAEEQGPAGGARHPAPGEHAAGEADRRRGAAAVLRRSTATPRDWRELLDRLGLESQANTYFGKLSGGQKQRLSVALALIGNPQVAILDELTTGLDPAARREVWGLLEDLKDTGVTLLLVSHFMEEAERLCDRVAVIDHGTVIALDTPEGLATGVRADQRMSFEPPVRSSRGARTPSRRAPCHRPRPSSDRHGHRQRRLRGDHRTAPAWRRMPAAAGRSAQPG